MTTPKGTVGTQLDLTKYVHFLFVFGGLLATYLAYKMVGNILFRVLGHGLSFPVMAAVSLAIGGGLALYLWRHERTNELSREVVSELSRVNWPTRQELGAATVVVIITSIIVAVILGLFDSFWSWVTGIIY